MRLADLPASVLHGAAEAPLRLYGRDGFEVIHAEQITLLRAIDKVVEVYTHRGYAGATRGSVLRLVGRFQHCDWVLLSRAAAAKRPAILRVDYGRASDGTRTYAARVAGVVNPVPISRRHWSVVRRQLGGGA